MAAAKIASTALLAACAMVMATAPAIAAELRRDQGWLALPLNSDRAVPRLEFRGRSDHELVVTGIKPGYQLVLVKAAADTYDLRKLNLGGNWYIEIAGWRDAPATVEVVAGAITYSGDLEMDARGSSTRFKFGGCSVDLLRGLAKGDSRHDAGILDRYPVAARSKYCEPLIAGGAATRSMTEWEALAGHVSGQHELEALNRMLERNGTGPLAFGQPASSAWKALEKLPKERMRAFRDIEQARAIWVRLEGLWGWRGNGAMYHLVVRDGAIVDAYLRGFVYDGGYGAPDQDLRRDVEDFADER